MSWYLFHNSPQQQIRGKKVDGYQNLQKNKVILDWGLGELSPKKQTNKINQYQRTYDNNEQIRRNHKSLNHQNDKIGRKQEKTKINEHAIKLLTQSSDQQDKEELMRVLNNYDKKKENKFSQNSNTTEVYPSGYFSNNQRINKSLNVLNPIEFDTDKSNRTNNKQTIDPETAKRMRFLENSLLPGNKRDNMSAVLDYGLNEKVGSSLSDSRLSGRSKLGNRKNESDVKLGDGFNAFVPIKEKVKDMNQKLKEMYQYDQWCKKRQTNQIKFG